MTITEFLLARIAEDEAGSIGTHWSRRARAECEAKRSILEEIEARRSMIPKHVVGDGDEHDEVIVEWAESTVLASLAAVYADHQDYREEWAR
ncbi:DUF6221 family protein [Nocardioides kongjuensis]|uniref:Uncharacterized protein n=2 Tax=Nocardioides kongjuensis TaxID=349522 RepID=A0A852RFG9_9ACTN|nr:DUF6221 family protein [Nocardioides kongjuensis]NYD33853.1 hypothetical protein [Nocardioides kongjuensis]